MIASSALDPSSDQLAAMWEDIDWDLAEARLYSYQHDLSAASERFDRAEVRRLQDLIVGDLDCRCLAVRKVSDHQSGPGIDKVRWMTPSEKMAAAFSLTTNGYRASCQRLVILKEDGSGRRRRVKLPTYYDRAIATLWSWALAPVVEASGERGSFAFRKGRSAHDALRYATDALKGKDAPEVVLVADIRAYYENIAHEWLLAHVPMDKHVLRELLGSGTVYAGALFPADDRGISLGNALSPVLGNFVLDGLQRAIYRAVSGDGPVTDRRNGRMVRFCDDIFVALRTYSDAERALAAIRDFCNVRGLDLSGSKTGISPASAPFDFLGYTIVKVGGRIESFPSDAKVERFIASLKEDIAGWDRSQRALIAHLNGRLRSWAGYFRYGAAHAAFSRIDVAVNTALLEAVIERYPKRRVKDLIDKYWYRRSDGEWCYAVPEDRTCMVARISDTPLATHRKVSPVANPYLDGDYFDRRQEERDIANVSGPWRAVWDRQEGRCWYCGCPILAKQARVVVATGNAARITPKHAAYIHEACAFDEIEEISVGSLASMSYYDVLAALEPIAARAEGRDRPLPDGWRYTPLLEYFARLDKAKVTLSFGEIEEIIGGPLPAHARKDGYWWRRYEQGGTTHPPRAWVDNGYEIAGLDIRREKVRFARAGESGAALVLPPELSGRDLPPNLVFEFESFCHDLVKRYGL